MNIGKGLRWLLVGFFAYLLGLSLLFLTSASVFTWVASNPEKMKTILSDSGVYQKIPSVLYENIESENQDVNRSVDLSDPTIKQAALDSFNPRFFQTSTESAVDGTYAWLEGETSQPKFVIDASQAKNNFANQIVEQESTRLSKLPVCDFKQLKQNNPNYTSIFNLECLPQGINLAKETEKAKTELANNADFFGDGKLDSKDIKDKSGKSIFDSNPDLPKKFQLAKNLPIFLAILSAVSAVAIYLLSVNKKQAVKRISKTLFAVGLLTVLAPIIIRFASGKLLPTVSNDELVTQIVRPITQQFYSATAGIYYLLGGIMLVVGSLLLLAISKNILKLSETK